MEQAMQEVKQHLGFLLEILSQRNLTALSSRLEEFKINPHCYYIMLIATEKYVTQKQIGEALCLNVNTVTRYLDFLEELNYAKRSTNPDNRKENFVQITTLGERIVRNAISKVNKERDDAFKPLTRDERKELHRLLLKLYESEGPR